ncbi:Nonsense-mediated mRNA decay protein [Gracilaria domingensis]|nr:Nonsense-mediated mRNA decay protein [Gracilaria domingensis]
MDRAPARRGRAASDRAGGSSRAPPNGARQRRRPPRPPPPQQAATRSRPRPKNRARKRPPPPTIAVKLVVRRLPPTLTAEQFSSYADPNGADKALWTAYYPGKVEAVGAVKRSAQVVRHSIAYLAFEKLEDASNFFHQFDAFKFVDTAKTVDSSLQCGTDYYARVERAMYQSTPPLNRRRPPSSLEGTIENDPDYLTFLAELKGDAEREQNELAATLASASTIVARPGANENENSAAKKQVITPLMEDVRARRRERDERKKAKAAVRGGRSKPRGNAPQPPSAPPANKSNERAESSKVNTRRKKRRGGDNVNVSKREEPVQDRGSTKSPAIERRNGQMRPVESNVSTPANSVNSSPYANSTTSMNGAPNGKGGSNRGGSSGRSRYARGQKGRGKFGQNGNGAVAVSARNEQQGCVALSMP